MTSGYPSPQYPQPYPQVPTVEPAGPPGPAAGVPAGAVPVNMPDQKNDTPIVQNSSGNSPHQQGHHGAYPPAPAWDSPGTHVWGYPAVLQDSSMAEHELARERRGTLCASLSLVFGFCFPMFWVVGAFVPFCAPRSTRVRTLACLNATAFIASTIIIVLCAALLGRSGRRY